MATKLDKPLTRETSLIHKMRPVLITLHPRSCQTSLADDALEFRLKGTRQSLRIRIEDVFRFAQNRAISGCR